MFTYNPQEDIEFEKGILFTNVDAFRATLKDYVIQKDLPLKSLKNEKTRSTAKCGVEGCPWRIHASPVRETTMYQIKTYNPQHICVMDNKSKDAKSNWIATKLVSLLRLHPQMSSKCVETKMVTKYSVHPNSMRIWRAKKKG